MKQIATTLPFFIAISAVIAAPAGKNPLQGLTDEIEKVVAAHTDEHWARTGSLLIPDFDNTEGLSPETRKIAERFGPQVKAIGGRGYYEYSMGRKSPPLDGISVKVIVFTDEAKCAAFCKKKYEREDSGFKKVEKKGYRMYQGRKHGKVVLAAGSIHVSVFRLKDPRHNEAIATQSLKILQKRQGAAEQVLPGGMTGCRQSQICDDEGSIK